MSPINAIPLLKKLDKALTHFTPADLLPINRAIHFSNTGIRSRIPVSRVSFRSIAKNNYHSPPAPDFSHNPDLPLHPLITPTVPGLICFNKPNGVLSKFASKADGAG